MVTVVMTNYVMQCTRLNIRKSYYFSLTIDILERYQLKTLRLITSAPWFVSNNCIRRNLNWSIHTSCCIVLLSVLLDDYTQRMLVVENFHVKIRYSYTHFFHMFFKCCVGFVLSNCLNTKKIHLE